MIYTSAGDMQAVINAMSAAGITRSQYYLWSAHWIGQHICSPASCGFPSADGTQYASNNSYDSDVFYAYVFPGAPVPVNPSLPLSLGDVDATATGGPVWTTQRGLNKWRAEIGLAALLATDGSFGPATEAAVRLALTYWNYSAANVALGQVDQSLYDHLLADPPPPVTRVSVPDVVGKSAGSAHNAIVAAKLVPEAAAGQTPSMICSATSPAAGTTVNSGTAVIIDAASPPVLTENIQGYVSWVHLLQRDLNKAGAGLTEDGSFGTLTLGAVKRFQASHGLGPDGEVGPLTWAQLGAL
jgi:peptidoglycan hydrolase-like protein with peptidoglycan-binding domain